MSPDTSKREVAAFHAEGRLVFAWDLQTREALAAALELGVDAVYSDHVDVMMAAIQRVRRSSTLPTE